MTFRQALWVSDGKSKLKSENEDTTHFENAIYRVLHESSSITAPFAEYLEFPEKKTFTHLLWFKRDKAK